MIQPSRMLMLLGGLAASWYGMMAVHELGHVIGSWGSGGRVVQVSVPWLGFSRTDVKPNPAPGFVVWAGPLLGTLIPLLLAFVIRRPRVVHAGLVFFAGFCFVANGGYLAAGVWDRVGDCEVMLDTGSPRGAIVAVGVAMVVMGFSLWHRLGSPAAFIRPQTANPPPDSPR